MKQIFTLLIATITSISMYAYGSKMSISSTSNAKLRVMVDGNRYKANNNSVVISNLQQGYHTVKVYRLISGNRPGSPNNNNGNYKLVYNANVYVKPQYHVDITINRFGKAFIDEQPIAATYNNDDDDDWNDDNWNDNNWNSNDNNYGREMNVQSFSSFKQTLEKESFDNTRMNIAKQVINTNYFTTAQVREVLQLFSFENNKLEIAKYAYKNTLDKGNYFSLADSFTFSSNKDELMRYIQNYR
ncbi:MAG: DUF4476 domain-containing protein [Bacteroidota bacterium]